MSFLLVLSDVVWHVTMYDHFHDSQDMYRAGIEDF